jgi:3-oxoacyl-[acyl-carrier-protein] synthase II
MAITRALKAASLQREEVDCIVAHGTGTPLNDAAETAAIKRALGEEAYNVAVSGSEVDGRPPARRSRCRLRLTAVLAIRDDVIPPTINLETPTLSATLTYPQTAPERPSVSRWPTASASGGQNGVIAFRAFEDR